MSLIKKIDIKTNKTKKNRREKNKDKCKNLGHVYKPFEEEINKIFEANKIDITSANYNLEKQVVKDLKKAVSPSKIMPNDDYYSFINERWIGELNIETDQGYIVQLDNFRLTQDKVYKELLEMLDEYTSNKKFISTKQGRSIKNAYESFKVRNTNEQIKCIATSLLNYINTLSEVGVNLWEKLARPNQLEVISWSVPFVWSIKPDPKNPKIYKCNLDPPKLTLIDLTVYFDDDDDTEEDKKYKKNYRENYFKYLRDLFNFAFGEGHGFHPEDIFTCEVEMLNAMTCDLIKNEDENGYNVVTAKEALKDFGFDWSAFCKYIGFKKVPDEFVTSNINYLLCGTKLLKEKWNTPQWKSYWLYLYIKELTRYCVDGYEIFYEFQGKFVLGQEKKISQSLIPIFSMGFLFNQFLTEKYIEKYSDEQMLEYVRMLAQDLRLVFIRILQRNKWLEPKTRDIAIDKLKNVKFRIGRKPDNLLDDPILDYEPDDPWSNTIKMCLYRRDQYIKLVGKDVVSIPVLDWSQTPPKFISNQSYIVNAMYVPSDNTVYVPVGYVQKPFVDLDERGIEYNLAHIGFTIAHELSHSLDDLGSKFNKYGQLDDWWTAKDKSSFKKIQDDIVDQYQKYSLYDNIKFDAWPSIGEDLADIVGFSICLEYLRDFQQKNQLILVAQALSFRTFFMYYAIQARQKISKKAILAQLKTNPHPLDKYRCNVPLSRSRIFRALYEVKKGDKMWWKNFSTVWSD